MKLFNHLGGVDPIEMSAEMVNGKRMYLTPEGYKFCLLYTSPSPRDTNPSRMPSSA